MSQSLPLAGQTALVTGVSRRRGIGYAIATRLAQLGASIVIQHYRQHDLEQPWGADDLDALQSGIRENLQADALFLDVHADLADTANISPLIEAGISLSGTLDILVCNHARSGGDGSILDMTPQTLDAFWNVNTRSTLLLTTEFARLHRPKHTIATAPGQRLYGDGPYAVPLGHVIWMTSGQMHSPMRGEVAYATSKAALAGVTATVAAELLEMGIVLNTVNPGPVNTGYLDPSTTDRDLAEIREYVASTPFGRVGHPADTADLVAWLVSPAGKWVVGQVITSDGGFSLR